MKPKSTYATFAGSRPPLKADNDPAADERLNVDVARSRSVLADAAFCGCGDAGGLRLALDGGNATFPKNARARRRA